VMWSNPQKKDYDRYHMICELTVTVICLVTVKKYFVDTDIHIGNESLSFARLSRANLSKSLQFTVAARHFHPKEAAALRYYHFETIAT